MRACYRSILLFSLCCHAVFGQALTASFQFPNPVKPGDGLTVTGTDLAGITAVTLKATGKPDLAATGVRATATSVSFTVPPDANGTYTVALTPGTIASIPLTVAPATVPPPTTSPVTPPTTSQQPTVQIYMPDGQLIDSRII